MNRMRTFVLALILALTVATPAMAGVQRGSGIEEAVLYSFDTPLISVPGGTGTSTTSVRRFIGPGMKVVNVQLRGWNLDFAFADHHIRTIRVRIENVQYNSTTGDVTFDIISGYRDKDSNDAYNWQARYAILGLK